MYNQVKKIFSYSKDIAEKNSCYYNFGKNFGLVLGIILIYVLLEVLLALAGSFIDSIIIYVIAIILAIFLWPTLFMIIYFFARRMSSRINCFILTEDNKLIRLSLKQRYHGKYSIDMCWHLNDMMDSNLILDYYLNTVSLHKIDIVNTEILKINHIIEKKYFYKVNADFHNEFNKKTYYHKNIIIYKVYQDLDELVTIIKNKCSNI